MIKTEFRIRMWDSIVGRYGRFTVYFDPNFFGEGRGAFVVENYNGCGPFYWEAVG